MARHAKPVKKLRMQCRYYVRLVRPYRIVMFCNRKCKSKRGYWGPYSGKRMAQKVRGRLHRGF